jgi:hypothetical protein
VKNSKIKKRKVKKEMVDIANLEATLLEQQEAGLITDHEFRRIMSRATGGVYLDSEQQEAYANAQNWSADVLATLNKLHVIGPKRMGSTTKKLNSALTRFISKGGYIGDDGSPDVSAVPDWVDTPDDSTDDNE